MNYTRKTPITWYGGKQTLLKYILPIVPEHKIYVEPFFGGGAVFFAKEPVKAEVINDLNKEAVNFYTVAKVDFNRLQTYVTSTLHSRSAFQDAKVIYQHPHLFDTVERAWSFYTMANQSFSANFSSWGFDRKGTTALKLVNKRSSFMEHIQERLASATIECDDALKVIMRYDCPDAFIYIDPPYFNSNCGHYSGYEARQFQNLLDLLPNLKGKWLMNSYPSELLRSACDANNWHQDSIVKKIAVSANSKGLKTEVFTANFPFILPT